MPKQHLYVQQSLLDWQPPVETPQHASKRVFTPDEFFGNPTDANQKIEDFGEKIGGAKKDLWQSTLHRITQATADDIRTQPLAKVFPEPKYAKMLEEGNDPKVVALLHAVRDFVATHKRQHISHSFAGELQNLLHALQELHNPEKYTLFVQEMQKKTGFSGILNMAELYQACGHDISLKDYYFYDGLFSRFQGEEFSEPRRVYIIKKDYRLLAYSLDKEKAIQDFAQTLHKEETAPKTKKNPELLIFWQGRQAKEYFVGVKIGRNYIRLSEAFDSVNAAREYRKDHATEMLEELERRKHLPYERKAHNQPRKGTDYRNGKNVTPEQFTQRFAFRGVEFGNWVDNEQRQLSLNEAYDALNDLAGILHISPQALSLNGELGLAFGARGSGKANAHYDSTYVVINLTKTRGAGSLAHEWFHALDNYFARTDGHAFGFLTDTPCCSKAVWEKAHPELRYELADTWTTCIRTLRNSNFRSRSEELDQVRRTPYWSTNTEMAARAFEAYVIDKLEENDAVNDYLANVLEEADWKQQTTSGYPYPLQSEMPEISKAFDLLFTQIKEQQTNKGLALASLKAYGVHGTPLPVAELRSLVRTFEEQSAHPRKTIVVNSIFELPKHLQNPDLEACTTDEAVYLVADNLYSKDRAAQVWMHEQVIHNGLHSLLSDQECNALMNGLFYELGGLENELISQIAETYQYSAGDPRLMEEVIAHLAEKKLIQEAEPREEGFWQKIVHSVTDAWNAFCGKCHVAPTPESRIDTLISALGRYVLDGIDTSHELQCLVNYEKDFAEYRKTFHMAFYHAMEREGFDERLYEDELRTWGSPWHESCFTQWENTDPEIAGNALARHIIMNHEENFSEKMQKDIGQFNAFPYSDRQIACITKEYVRTFMDGFDTTMKKLWPEYDVDTMVNEFRINPACPWLSRPFNEWFGKDPLEAGQEYAKASCSKLRTVFEPEADQCPMLTS